MQVFLSHSHRDRDFVDKLANSLRKADFDVWLDRAELKVGDNLVKSIDEALAHSDAVVPVISPNFVDSPWLSHELAAAASREFSEDRKLILPALIADTEIPVFLRDRVYADFRTSFDEGLRALLTTLRAKGKSSRRRRQLLSELPEKELKAETLDLQLHRIRAEFAQGNLTLFCGAGVSMAADVPSWSELLNTLLVDLFLQHAKENKPDELVALYQKQFTPSPLMIAQYLKNGLGRDYLTRLREVLYKGNPTTTPLIDAIVELARPRRNHNPLHAIVTFNFDDLIEHNLSQHAVTHCCIFSEGQRPRASEIPIYHVHGYLPRAGELSEAHSVVFSEDAYHSQFIDPFSWSNLVQLSHLGQSLCLLVGLSLTDPNLRRLLDVAMRKNPERQLNHYLFKKRLVPKLALTAARRGASSRGSDASLEMLRVAELLEESDARNLGLNIIWVDDYSEIPAFLHNLIDDY
jgi:hypothetical protein